MFKKLSKNFMQFITTDVKEESESKDLAVLLRVLSLMFGVYCTIMAVLIAALGHYNLSFLLLFFLGGTTIIFICTYENKTQLSLYLFNGIVIVACSFLTVEVGFSLNYHWLIFLSILLTFYNIKTSLQHKFIYSAVVIFIVLLVTIFSYSFPSLNPPAIFFRITILILNIALFAGSIITIANFYCNKYTASEDKIMQYNRKLLKMASTDALTSLANRRSMNEHLQDLVFSSSKSGKSFSIAIGDIDFFKHVNDQYGHDAGDYVLSTLADLFIKYLSSEGMVARWGGEEFLFTFENATAEQAYQKLEALLILLHNNAFRYKEHTFHISMTFGLEEYTGQVGIDAVISRADSKLYTGKNNGRNQIVY